MKKLKLFIGAAVMVTGVLLAVNTSKAGPVNPCPTMPGCEVAGGGVFCCSYQNSQGLWVVMEKPAVADPNDPPSNQ